MWNQITDFERGANHFNRISSIDDVPILGASCTMNMATRWMPEPKVEEMQQILVTTMSQQFRLKHPSLAK